MENISGNLKQQEASCPDHSIWVAASAGTGKTKILTDRILRLLIKGAAPNKILCLTFTNAAASEMTERLLKRLLKWSNLETEALYPELMDISGQQPSLKDIITAQNLHSELINCEQGIQIHTIHSYCQKLLKFFPFESNISPGFQVISDIEVQFIINEIKPKVFLSKNNVHLLDYFAASFHDKIVDEIFKEILKNRYKFIDLCKDNQSIEILRTISDQEIIKELNVVSELYLLEDLRLSNIEEILNLFLTNEGEKRARIINKKFLSKNLELLRKLTNLQDKVYKFDQERKTAKMVKYSNLIKELAGALIREYESYKNDNALLDYDDLIHYTNRLLTQNISKEWVLYKLDGGIDHLLVDEAQDTSQKQWEIITALIEEFYAGEGKEGPNRTIFVVGDDKQSIFSFQGADAESFVSISNSLKHKLQNAHKSFRIIKLDISYRSYGAILESVYNVFNNLKKCNNHFFAADNHKILPSKINKPGQVIVWPIVSASSNNKVNWPLPNEHNFNTPSLILANKIALYIKHQLSTDQTLKPNDFMILVRTRDHFLKEIIDQLISLNVEVAGVDRLNLSNNLAVLDIVSAAKFIISPEDDLNTSCLLKSPIIGFTEEQMYEILSSRGEQSLWNYILNNDTKLTATLKLNLKNLMKLGCYNSASRFFHVLVDILNIRDTLNASSIASNDDAINELLFLAKNYEDRIDSSLQSFIFWFENNDVDIKRDIETASGVKLMTCHGSKGLQSKIIILADTTSTPVSKDRFIWNDDGQFLAVEQSSEAPEIFKNFKTDKQSAEIAEYCRLLYVGMTRAEERLIICGYSNSSNLPKNCWYEIAQPLKDECVAEFNDGDVNHKAISINSIKFKPNDLTYNQQSSLQQISDFKINSPLTSNRSLEYGRLLHKLLEDTMKARDISILKYHPLLQTYLGDVTDKIFSIIDRLTVNEEFINLMNFELLVEVNIGLHDQGCDKIGRIDLLAIDSDRIIIIDYKSDVFVPLQVSDVHLNYINQLEFYKKVILKIYPDKMITAKILWLEEGRFMTI